MPVSWGCLRCTLMTEGRDPRTTSYTRDVQTRNPKMVRHDLRAGQQEEAAKGEATAAYIPHPQLQSSPSTPSFIVIPADLLVAGLLLIV